jgi:radical SAM-linked protein
MQQRLRIRFSRGEEVKFLSHLDLMRLWERAFRRSGFSLVYSEGFTPHPKISLGVPLQVGVTSEAEVMDVWLAQWLSVGTFMAEIRKQLPRGIRLLDTILATIDAPSLQAAVRFAEYTIEIEPEKTEAELRSSIDALLKAETFIWTHQRAAEERRYDLRGLIEDIWLISYATGHCKLGMRLKSDVKGTGRPEQVLKALGLEAVPISIHRTKLLF